MNDPLGNTARPRWGLMGLGHAALKRGAVMRLSEFLRVHAERILGAWDEFASTIPHDGKHLDRKALRDHAGQILREIADDLDAPQTPAQQIAKSRGEGERDEASGDTAAETHADTRIVAGFSMEAMLTEYRALR